VSRGQPESEARRPLRGRRVFLSASIPGEGWDDVEFDLRVPRMSSAALTGRVAPQAVRP
jgi:hypothetical protein